MYKQVILINATAIRKYHVGKGKVCAHVAHASLEAYKEAKEMYPRVVELREMSNGKKVVLKASEGEIIRICEIAKRKLIPCAIIRDAGRTQVPPGTILAAALGPWYEISLNKLTGHLKLR